MNGLEKIIGRIQTDTREELAQLRQATEEKAAAIRREAEAQTAQRLSAGRAQNEAAAESHKARLISAANMASRQQVLDAKQGCIDQVFEQARERLEKLPSAEYADVLAKWAASAAETGTEELIFDPQHRETIGKLVVDKANQLRSGAAFTLSQETRPVDGVILRRGSVEINGSISARLSLLREQMAAEVAQTLFS